MSMWNNLKLKGKFGIGFGMILVLLAGVSAWAVLGISEIVRDAEGVIDGNKLYGIFIQKELDHLTSAEKVNRFLNDSTITKSYNFV